MNILFHGGAREVGRSCIEIQKSQSGQKVLLDCGLKLTPEGTKYPVGFDRAEDIDAVFISHAHLDHTGALPLLDHKGMDCPIFMTKTTKKLSRLLLKDAFKVGKITHQHLGYDIPDINKAIACMQRVVNEQKGSYKGIEYEYFDAGHIPGSSSILLKMDGKTIFYTGDMKTTDTKLLNAARVDLPPIDVMICESTYGTRDHKQRSVEEHRFIESIQKTIEQGGSVLIPVFAVGRAQEILLLLSEQKFNVPIYFDGMGIKATEITIQENSSKNPEKLRQAFGNIKRIKDRKERSLINHKQAIIVTTSGMLTGGPVLGYLKHMHKNKQNTIILTGYQGEETNGRLLLEKGFVFIDGWKYKVACNTEQFDFSAHDGKTELKNLVKKINPKEVIFVHGEEASVIHLFEWADALGMQAHAPKLNETIHIEL